MFTSIISNPVAYLYEMWVRKCVEEYTISFNLTQSVSDLSHVISREV